MLIKCNACKCLLDSSSCNAKKGNFKFEGGQSMWLTYYDCPRCGKRIFCQIDDEVTNSFLRDLTKVIARIAKYNRNGQTPPKKLQHKYDTISGTLRRKRRELLGTYNDSWFEDEDRHSWKVTINGNNNM